MSSSTAGLSPAVVANLSVVLVETRQAGNIGSAARAIKNMGLRNLKLVKPPLLTGKECLKMAGRACDLIAAARVYRSFDEAVGEENILVGTTSTRDRKPRQRFYTPREVAPLVCEYAQSARVALLFGPENRGLTDSQLAQCQCLVLIPGNPEHPVLNVAQSVMILAYEIFNLKKGQLNRHLRLASYEQREQMFAHIQRVLLEIGFLHGRNPHAIMRVIRRFLGRADLTGRDIQIIRGIMSHMEWYAQEGHTLPAKQVRKS